MGKAELWLAISHWVCSLCQEFGFMWITSFNSLSRVGGIERLDWKWCRSVSEFLFWDWSPVWPGFKPALSTIYWTFLLHDIIKEEQLGPLGRQPGGFTTTYLGDQAMKKNYNISKTCWRSHKVGVGQTAHSMRRSQLEEDQWRSTSSKAKLANSSVVTKHVALVWPLSFPNTTVRRCHPGEGKPFQLCMEVIREDAYACREDAS